MKNPKILLLTHSFNSLTQRVFVALTSGELGVHADVSVEFDIHDSVSLEAASLFKPDLVIAPFLKRPIPEAIYKNVLTWVVHPGPPGDRGPNSLDWAIWLEKKTWGVTVLQAEAEMDAGPIWGYEIFDIRPQASKSSLYRQEVTQGAIRALASALKTWQSKGQPWPSSTLAKQIGFDLETRPALPKSFRQIDFDSDPTSTILKKIRASDSVPGAIAKLNGDTYRLYNGTKNADETKENEEPKLNDNNAYQPFSDRPTAGQVLKFNDFGALIGTIDGAIWVTHMKKISPDGTKQIKLPAHVILEKNKLTNQTNKLTNQTKSDKPSNPSKQLELNKQTYFQKQNNYDFIRFKQEQHHGLNIGYLFFDFYSGAFSTHDCLRLRDELLRIKKTSPLDFLVLMGGADFWSNGIHLGLIEHSASPAEESMRNIEAMDDWVLELLNCTEFITISAIHGNCGAGGFFAALAADFVWAKKDVVLNPHYKNMGNLYGSEYWTYSLPKRLTYRQIQDVMGLRQPLGARQAQELGLIDHIFGQTQSHGQGEKVADFSDISVIAREIADLYKKMDLDPKEFLKNKQGELQKLSLIEFRESELKRMKMNFFGFDPSYHVARYNFIFKILHSKTPLHLAKHRN